MKEVFHGWRDDLVIKLDCLYCRKMLIFFAIGATWTERREKKALVVPFCSKGKREDTAPHQTNICSSLWAMHCKLGMFGLGLSVWLKTNYLVLQLNSTLKYFLKTIIKKKATNRNCGSNIIRTSEFYSLVFSASLSNIEEATWRASPFQKPSLLKINSD